MSTNNILRKFYEAVENAKADDEEKLDIEQLLTTRQLKIFTLHEEIVGNLFSGNSLQEGLTKVIDGRALTQTEQVTVLMFLKLLKVLQISVNYKYQTSQRWMEVCMLKHNHIIIVDVLCGVLSTSKRGLDSRYNIKKGVKI